MNDHQKALKSLADTTFDSVKGYKMASEKANSPQLKQALAQCAQQREQTLGQLNAELTRQGVEQVDGTVLGSAHQMFASVVGAFENGDENAVERVNEGEDYLAKKFQSALDDDDLDPQSRQVVQTAYQDIQAGERMSDQLKKQFD
ncbi:MAG: PA2169 family four-helix-bundle protein [Pontixanthobacter sp.]